LSRTRVLSSRTHRRGGAHGRIAALTLAIAIASIPGPAPAQPSSKAAPAPAQRSAVPAEPVALNFKDAEIDEVVAAFGHLLGRTFMVDPRVKGKITLETPKSVSRGRAYELLQASLRAQGFAIVDGNGFSRVVPEADAKLQSGPVRVGQAGERDREGDDIVTQIFRLNHESASNLVPVLRPLIAPNNTIVAYPSNNSLVITDYAANLRRLGAIIASLDSPSTSEVEVVQIRHAIAADIALAVARMVDDASRAGGQGTQVDPGQRVLVQPDPRLNSVIIRTVSAAKMNLAKSLIARLDQPSSQPGNIHVVYLRNAEAVRLAQVLRGVLVGDAAGASGQTQSGVGGSAGGSMTGQFQQGGAVPATGAMGGSAPGSTGFGATGQSSTGLGAIGGASTGGQGVQPVTFQAGGAVIAADPSTNSLIVTASEPVYRNLRAVIDRLDARRAQVFIESLIVEVSAEKAAELGVQWQFLDGLTGNTSRVFGGTNLPPGGTGANILDLVQNPLSAAQGLNLGVVKGAVTVGGTTIFNLGLLARALETGANANILATPNLLTLDNEEARIIIGQNLPFTTGQFTSTGTATGTVNPFQTIERRDIGTQLRVRPQVSESGTVRMQIFQETSSLQSFSPQGPITNRRAIESNVLVDDGQIVVLGGLIEDKVSGGEQKVPLVGDIPVIGQMFRYDNRKREKTNLLVFLRPVVLRDANAAHDLTNDRYEQIGRLRSESRPSPHWALPAFEAAPMPPMPARPAASGASPGAPGSPAGSMVPVVPDAPPAPSAPGGSGPRR
jgi:general secretion pathway protein D